MHPYTRQTSRNPVTRNTYAYSCTTAYLACSSLFAVNLDRIVKSLVTFNDDGG